MADKRKQAPRCPTKPYSKPELLKIELRPEEAVLGNCKVSGAGPVTNCHSPQCFVLGT